MRLRVIDCETTGIDPATALLVEVGSTDLTDETGIWNEDKWLCQLANPGIPIPYEAMATHHIMNEDVAESPSPGDAMALYHQACAGDPDFWVAHNAAYDRGILQRLGTRYAAPARWIDTWRCAKHLWEDAPGYSLQVLRYWLGIGRDLFIPDHLSEEETAPHRALFDTIVTAEVLKRMLTLKTPEELVVLSTTPKLLKICTLYKHKGLEWSKVPKGYLDWCVKQQDMDMDIRHTAMYYLNNPQGSLL